MNEWSKVSEKMLQEIKRKIKVVFFNTLIF